MFSFIGFMLLLGALVDFYDGWNRAFNDEDKAEKLNKKTDNTICRFLRCFSFNTNGKRLMDTDKVPGHMRFFDGIRVISMMWIVLFHVYLLSTNLFLKNPFKYEQMFYGESSFGYELILNAFPAADTFFFIGGFLAAYLAFADMEKGVFSLWRFYLHRYLRLTIPVMLCVAFAAKVLPLAGSGMQWYKLEELADNCAETWWVNLLYVQNFVHQDKQCMYIAWYLACDMQFYVVAPLLIYPMYKLSMNYSVPIWSVFFIAATVVLMALSLSYNLPPSYLFMFDTGDFDMKTEFYQRPYTHYQPYLIGMLLALIIFKIRDKKTKIHWSINGLLWVCSVALGFAVVFGLYSLRGKTRPYDAGFSKFESAFYHGFSRIAWGLALSWVTFACVKGHGGKYIVHIPKSYTLQ